MNKYDKEGLLPRIKAAARRAFGPDAKVREGTRTKHPEFNHEIWVDIIPAFVTNKHASPIGKLVVLSTRTRARRRILHMLEQLAPTAVGLHPVPNFDRTALHALLETADPKLQAEVQTLLAQADVMQVKLAAVQNVLEEWGAHHDTDGWHADSNAVEDLARAFDAVDSVSVMVDQDAIRETEAVLSSKDD